MTLDVMSNSPFFTSNYKAIWNENPVVYRKSLNVFFHASLELQSCMPNHGNPTEAFDYFVTIFRQLSDGFFCIWSIKMQGLSFILLDSHHDNSASHSSHILIGQLVNFFTQARRRIRPSRYPPNTLCSVLQL